MNIDIKRVMSEDEATALVNVDTPMSDPIEMGQGDRLIDVDTGETVLVLERYPAEPLPAFRRAALGIPMTTTYRASGQRNVASTIGYSPRAGFMQQRASCRVCASSYEAPEAHSLLCDSAEVLWAMLQEHLPEAAAQTAQAAAGVLPDWRLGDSGWTSGIVNDTSALFYHRDRNNFRGAWSSMVVVRRDTRGGHLHLPEYDITVPCRDGSVLMFAGPEIVHGVTPIKRRPGGYRRSVVYYSVAKMAHCLPIEQEIKRAQATRTESAVTMIERQRNSGFLR